MATPDEVKAEVQARAVAGEFIAKLADRIGANLQAAAVFGDPVERGSVTVVPVAKATWGMGGGSGDKPDERGLGGGGGGTVAPIGFIEISESGAEYKPIRDWQHGMTAAVSALTVAAWAARALARRRR